MEGILRETDWVRFSPQHINRSEEYGMIIHSIKKKKKCGGNKIIQEWFSPLNTVRTV